MLQQGKHGCGGGGGGWVPIVPHTIRLTDRSKCRVGLELLVESLPGLEVGQAVAEPGSEVEMR